MKFEQLYKMLSEAEARDRNAAKKDRKKVAAQKKKKRKVAKASRKKNR